VWKKFWNDNYLFEVELLQHFLRLRKLSGAVCCTSLAYVDAAWLTSIIHYLHYTVGTSSAVIAK